MYWPWIKLLGPWLVFLTSFLILHRIKFQFRGTTALLFIAICVFLFRLDTIILGSLSPPEWGDGAGILYGFFPYLSSQLPDEIWLHELAGGSDKYTLGRFGGEYFSIRRELSAVFPMWAVIVFSRILITTIAAVGMFLLLHKKCGVSAPLAASAGLLYAFGCEFNSALTFYYGLSLSALPLASLLFIYVAEDFRLSRVLSLAIFSLIYIGFADPWYTLPVFVFHILLIVLWTNGIAGCARVILPLTLMCAAWVANYIEVFAAIADTSTSSAAIAVKEKASFGRILFEQSRWLLPQFLYNRGGMTMVVPLVAFIVAWTGSRKSPSLFAMGTFVFFSWFLASFLVLVPWHQIGLIPFTNYSFSHLGYASFSLFILFSCIAVSGATLKLWQKSLTAVVTSAFLATTCGYVYYSKIRNIEVMAARGTLTSIQSIPNLVDKSWAKESFPRVASIPGFIDSNSLANYGFISTGIVANLVHQGLADFWKYAGRGPKAVPPGKAMLGIQGGIESIACDEERNVEDLLDTEWLRTLNVQYIISFFKLRGQNLLAVSQPLEPCGGFFKQETIFGRGKFLIRELSAKTNANRDAFVYRLKNPLPFAYATNCLIEDKTADAMEFFQSPTIKQNVLERCGYLPYGTKLSTLYQSERSDSPRKNRINIEFLTNGYRLRSEQGIQTPVIINVPFNSWWSAKSRDGKSLRTLSVNHFQTLVLVEDITPEILLEYTRPLRLAPR